MVKMALNQDKIREQGIKIIEEFSRKLSGVPETKETHYVVDMKNVTRADAKAVQWEGFREKLKRLAPKWENNHVVSEKGAE